MFDCPEQTQTSPTSTSCSVMVFLPAMVTSSGVVEVGSLFEFHGPTAHPARRSQWALSEPACHGHGLAGISRAPHTGTPSVALQDHVIAKIAGIFTSACATVAADTHSIEINKRREEWMESIGSLVR